MAHELPSAFERGVSFDSHAIKGFKKDDKSDLLLFPDPATLSVLPWRPGPGRVVRFFCDIKTPEGTIFEQDPRAFLKKATERFTHRGLTVQIGTECEFYLFNTDEDGEPTKVTLDKGGYLDMAPLDKGENIRREICLTLEEIGIKPETSHHEQGPGQNEIDFVYSNALQAADDLLTFKSVVKSVASRNGLFASFMPKPLADAPGSGLHINISLTENGTNLFKGAEQGHSKVAESFIAGILNRVEEISIFLNPLTNSYERLGAFEAPKYVSWSHQNRSQLVRIPAADPERMRMELRSPDPTVNPYLAFALLLEAGLEGIEQNTPLREPVEFDLHTAGPEVTQELRRLPSELAQAITLAEESLFVKQILGETFCENYLAAKKEEAFLFSKQVDVDAFNRSMYFEVV